MESNTIIKDSIPDALAERIRQRSEHLANTAEQRRANREVNAVKTENSDYFLDNFLIMKNKIDEKIEQSKMVEKSDVLSYLDDLVSDVNKMQTFLNECSMFLPSFQIKKAQMTIASTNELVQNLIQELQPKKKFGFKKRTTQNVKPKPVKSVDIPDSSEIKMSQSLSEHFKEKLFFGFKDKVDEVLQKPADELKNRQLNLLNLEKCKVIALGNPSSLQFANLKDTLVIIGPTTRSAFIKDCVNCTFVLACQQVRIHTTKDTKFYLHVTGSAIIENCRNVSFAPYTLEYEGLDKHYEESCLSRDENNWRNIEDFKWLNEKEKSPNYSMIEEDHWEKNWLY